MRLVTFSTSAGQRRIGARLDGRIADLTSATAAYLRDSKRESAFERLAPAYVPPDMRLFFSGGDSSLDMARRALDSVASHDHQLRGSQGEPVFYRADEVRIEAPIIPRKFFHTAGNFREHHEEAHKAGFSHPVMPWIVFFQNIDAIIGPDAPVVYPQHLTQELDYELELAVWVGPGNALGEPIPIARAGEHLFGLGLFNDWSARDIQQWESQPLGPFLGKSFGSTVSPWIITPEALAPFRVAQPPRPAGDPAPLPHLRDDIDQREGAFDIALEALLMTEGLRAKGLPPHRMSVSNTTDLYWTVAQMIAHHASNGCNLAPGDLFGSGTISGPTAEGYGSLMELSNDGTRSITLGSGETRIFVEDGDEVIFRAHCQKAGCVPIGFGESRARII